MLNIHQFSFLKPFLPRRLQIIIRRALIRWQLPAHRHVWPIDPKSAGLPENWQGWPEGKKFALVLTHDVDTQYGHDHCLHLADIEKRLGFRSSFNFVAEDYQLSSEVFTELKSSGFEIGLHGIKHLNPFHTRSHFQEQATKINRYLKDWGAVGFRGPSMYHNLSWIHDLDIEYDASTFDTDPFEPQPDGMSTIFPFWVAGNGNKKGYVELPYTLPQDFLLFVLMNQKSIDIWKSKLDWVAEHGGMALFIAHPDYMDFTGNDTTNGNYPPRYYGEFLEYISTRYKGQFWQALPREVARFWASRYSRTQGRPRKPIRACMAVYSFYESDNRVMRYAEALAKRGDEVDVIALNRGGTPAFEKIRGVNVHRIQTRTIDERGKLSYLLKILRFLFNSSVFLTKSHSRKPYDLIHVHSVPDFEVFAAVLPKMRGAKIILDIHDIVPEFYASKFNESRESILFKALALMEKVSIQFSDHVIISNHLWEKTLLSRSAERHECTVVLNYPDESLFYRRPRERSDGRFIMIYPGTLGWHQGLDVAVRAFAKIKDQMPMAEFHIYGRGPEKENLENLIAELGLENKVLIKETIPIDQIADVMAEADLGIIPKRNDPFGGEAFSTKSLEFMALGIPTIVSETKIDRFYFNDNVVKFFKPDDAYDLAQCMLLLGQDRELRERLRINAGKFVEDYSWDKRKTEYLHLVDALVRRQ